MDINYILLHVDHTLLKPVASNDEIKKLCEEAIKFNMASVCVPETYVKRVKDWYKDKINICTVIGFPLGYNTTESKIVETKNAINDGASEIDMVINITDVKNKLFDNVENEIKQIRNICNKQILKVIIETCYLTEEEKITMCQIVTNAKADYIKTSTGFGTAGATKEDIVLFKKYIGENVKMKAAGGIRTKEDMIDYLNLGVDRLGTSSALKILI